METASIPVGYCQCGCGQKTDVAKVTRTERRQVRGEPLMYRHQHNGKQRLSRTAQAKGLGYCSACKRELSKDQFHRCAKGKKGRCRECTTAWHRLWVSRNPERADYLSRKSQLAKRYGISPQDYEAMFSEQNGLCAICGATEHRKNRDGSVRKLHIDHDHKTGAVRGLLCNNCNRAVGMLGDDPNRADSAAKYLRKFNGE